MHARRTSLCLAAAVISCALALPAGAALAPQYERVREFNAVMAVASEAATRLYAHGPIERVERLVSGTYRFWTKRCFVPVKLEVVPPPDDKRPVPPGTPIAYRAVLGEVECV